MKKLILTLVLTVAVIATSFYAQIKNCIYPEKTISKDISLKVFAGSDYSAKAYDHSVAKLHITVFKVQGNENTIVLEKEYPALHLEKFPSLTQTVDQTLHISGVVDSREQIVIVYTIKYKTKGSVLTIENAKWVAKGIEKDQLHITI
ncbi:MAG: hypothetical protein ICV51_14040 [Flavisolibacter sp.]|nr:hypothetical protein [Flavisolibacter sp.]